MGLYRNMHGERTREWKPVLSSKGAMVKKNCCKHWQRCNPCICILLQLCSIFFQRVISFSQGAAGRFRTGISSNSVREGSSKKKSQGREVWVKGFRVRTSDTPESPRNTSLKRSYRKATVSIGVAFFGFGLAFFLAFGIWLLFWLSFSFLLAFFKPSLSF